MQNPISNIQSKIQQVKVTFEEANHHQQSPNHFESPEYSNKSMTSFVHASQTSPELQEIISLKVEIAKYKSKLQSTVDIEQSYKNLKVKYDSVEKREIYYEKIISQYQRKLARMIRLIGEEGKSNNAEEGLNADTVDGLMGGNLSLKVDGEGNEGIDIGGDDERKNRRKLNKIKSLTAIHRNYSDSSDGRDYFRRKEVRFNNPLNAHEGLKVEEIQDLHRNIKPSKHINRKLRHSNTTKQQQFQQQQSSLKNHDHRREETPSFDNSVECQDTKNHLFLHPLEEQSFEVIANEEFKWMLLEERLRQLLKDSSQLRVKTRQFEQKCEKLGTSLEEQEEIMQKMSSELTNSFQEMAKRDKLLSEMERQLEMRSDLIKELEIKHVENEEELEKVNKMNLYLEEKCEELYMVPKQVAIQKEKVQDECQRLIELLETHDEEYLRSYFGIRDGYGEDASGLTIKRNSQGGHVDGQQQRMERFSQQFDGRRNFHQNIASRGYALKSSLQGVDGNEQYNKNSAALYDSRPQDYYSEHGAVMSRGTKIEGKRECDRNDKGFKELLGKRSQKKYLTTASPIKNKYDFVFD